jgi:Reverse transcriptase (RNA-dependent DNA polymerase)
VVQLKTKEWEENRRRSNYSKAICLKGRRDHLKTHNRSPNVSSKTFHPVTLNCDFFKHTPVHISLTETQSAGQHKARPVADGHLTDVPLESVYSGVVSLRSIRISVFLAELKKLELWASDIGNAYLEATTSEKVYIIAGSEFRDLKGHVLVINKALYGL